MLKEDLSIDTTFNPHQFSSDSTFNDMLFISLKNSLTEGIPTNYPEMNKPGSHLQVRIMHKYSTKLKSTFWRV